MTLKSPSFILGKASAPSFIEYEGHDERGEKMNADLAGVQNLVRQASTISVSSSSPPHRLDEMSDARFDADDWIQFFRIAA